MIQIQMQIRIQSRAGLSHRTRAKIRSGCITRQCWSSRLSRLDVCEGTLSVSVSSYRWRPSRLSLLQVPRRTQPCRPPRPLRSRSNAPTRPVCSPSGFGIRQISHSAPVAPCTAHLCPTPCAQHVQPLNVPVRELLHVGYWASAWVDRVGLLSRAPALRGRADIEICAAAEDAASRQGSSADGEARSWLARRWSGRSSSSTMKEDGC